MPTESIKDSMCEVYKNQFPELYGKQGVQVYLNGQQVFNVIAAATFSKRDRESNSTWVNFIKFNNGDVKTGDISITIDGVSSADGYSLGASTEENPIPLDLGSQNTQSPAY